MCYQNFKIYSRNCCLAFWSFSVGLKDATCASGSFYLLLPIAKQLCLLWLQFPKKFVKLIFTANQIFDLSANSPCQITKERLWQLRAALCSCNKCHFLIVPERIYFKRSISSHWRFSSVCCLSQFFFSYWFKSPHVWGIWQQPSCQFWCWRLKMLLFKFARLLKSYLTQAILWTDSREDCECGCTEIESIQTSYLFSSRNLEMMSTMGNTPTQRMKWTVTLTSMRVMSPTVTKKRMRLGEKAGLWPKRTR